MSAFTILGFRYAFAMTSNGKPALLDEVRTTRSCKGIFVGTYFFDARSPGKIRSISGNLQIHASSQQCSMSCIIRSPYSACFTRVKVTPNPIHLFPNSRLCTILPSSNSHYHSHFIASPAISRASGLLHPGNSQYSIRHMSNFNLNEVEYPAL